MGAKRTRKSCDDVSSKPARPQRLLQAQQTECADALVTAVAQSSQTPSHAKVAPPRALRLTTDHTPRVGAERARIEAAGGSIHACGRIGWMREIISRNPGEAQTEGIRQSGRLQPSIEDIPFQNVS